MHLLGNIALALLPLVTGWSSTVDIPTIGLAAPVVTAQRVNVDATRHTWTVPCSEAASTVSLGGNTIFFGHRDICGGVFDDLHLAKPGDGVFYGGKSYVVREQHVVVPTQSWPVQDFGDDRLTLISCWPPGSTAQRLVVVATIGPPSASPGDQLPPTVLSPAPATAPGSEQVERPAQQAESPAPAPAGTQGALPDEPSRPSGANPPGAQLGRSAQPIRWRSQPM